MKFDGFGLLDRFSDFRKGKQREVAVFSPVGDEGQLEGFVAHVKKLGIAGKADFIFVVRPGLEPARTGLSELRCYEKLPLGTSGCFFAGQALAYRLGYKTIVVADLDASLDSPQTYLGLEAASKKGCVAVAPEKSPQDTGLNRKFFIVNHWGFFPRGAYENAGFPTPYLWKGAEDFEIARRMERKGILQVAHEGFVTHPFPGYTIYHKMADRAKYYPYVAGYMKANLFLTTIEASAYARYAAWHMFYSFFADAFGDSELHRAIKSAPGMEKLAPNRQEKPPLVAVAPSGQPGGDSPNSLASRALFAPVSLALLLSAGRFRIYRDEVALTCGREMLAAGIFLAILKMPVRLAQCLLALARWQRGSRKFPYPVVPGNFNEALEAFAKILSDPQ